MVGLDQDNILQVRLTGACQGCSSSIMTLDHEGRGHPQGPGAGDSLRRGRSVTAAAPKKRPSRAGDGPGRPTSTSLSAPQMRILRLRLAGRRRPSGRSIPGCARARDRNLACRARRKSTRSSWAAVRPPGSMPASCRDFARIIKQWLILAPGGEWTVEANPGTIDAEKADVLAEAGVDRISLGAQSFQPRLLAGPRACSTAAPRSRRPSKSFARGSPAGRST